MCSYPQMFNRMNYRRRLNWYERGVQTKKLVRIIVQFAIRVSLRGASSDKPVSQSIHKIHETPLNACTQM